MPPVIGAGGASWALQLLAGLWHLGDLLLLAIAAIASVGWQVSCHRAERSGRYQATPLVVFGPAIAALILLSGWGSDVGGLVGHWTAWVGLRRRAAEPGADGRRCSAGPAGDRQQVVRLVLGSVGAVKPAGQPQASDQLKGGRLLGPMERLLIVGLGLAGQLTMATAVVAAKSIIRFPEISAKRDREGNPERVGIDDVTEYFLVGSFASWILAFGGLALVAAAN